MIPAANIVKSTFCVRFAVAWMTWLPLVSIAEADGLIRLRDVTRQTGITFRHTDGGSGQRYIMETVSAGLAVFDYNHDGRPDLYFLNGAPLRGTKTTTPPRNSLYRNDGNWKFTDVTNESGLGDPGFGLGVTVGDYDNDGDPDVYLNNFGPNVLYRNNGDGTFSNVTAQAGVANGSRVGAGACFFDMDADGDLDLYVANYLKFSYDKHVLATEKGFPAYASPTRYPADPDTLYRNNGDGTFTDVSVASGIAAHAGWGMGTVCADYDNDGDTDVFVANDLCANFLFRNDGTGKFEEEGLVSGIGYDLHGDEQGSMGVECGDYNNDGLLDFHQTSYQKQFATLFQNFGDGFFEDVTLRTRAGAGTLPHVTWGSSLADFDNDGDRDLFVACGHLQDNIAKYDDTTAYLARNVLLENLGRAKFANVSDSAGDGMQVALSSRGCAMGDLDGDGDLDVVVLNSRREPTLLRNDSLGENHWLRIRLQGAGSNRDGVKSNRDGIGARVTVVAGDLTQVDEVHSGRGYQSYYGAWPHFGLGRRNRVDRVEVRWIGGGVDVVRNVPVDRLTVIRQGSSPPRE